MGMRSSAAPQRPSATPMRGHGGVAMGRPGIEAFMVAAGKAPLTEAFARRAPVVPWRGAMPIAEADQAAALLDLTSRPHDTRSVAYLHTPFCHNHCLFCGFYQNPWREEWSASFVDTVIKEIAQAARTPLVGEGPAIEAVYCGGGTPTALHAHDIVRLIRALRQHLPLAAACEITLEGRVYDFGLDKAKAAIDAGVNRISLGVQSFDTQVRRRLGRKTDADTLVKEISALVALEGTAIVVDLMYGLPGQNEDVWLRDLAHANALDLDGLDVYALNVWPNGPLAQAVAAGKALPLPALPAQARAYAQAGEMLAGAGWRQISHAHFARTALERNIYNRSVKEGATCLAFGPGAGGYAHGCRWRNVSDLTQWQQRVADGTPTVAGLARVSPNHKAETLIVAGLEAGTLDCTRVEAAAPGFLAHAAPLLRNWCAAGLGEWRDEVLTLTRAGWFWMTTMTAGLHTVLDGLGEREAVHG